MRGHFGLITCPPNKSKPLGEVPFALSTHFPPLKTSGGSFFFIYLNRTDSTSFVACERWLIQFSFDTFIEIFILDSHFLSLTICAGSGFLGLFIIYIFV